jgi:hypothetical protein
MDQIYKGHNIQVSAWRYPSGWKPSIDVTYLQGDKDTLKNITMDQIFPTYGDAEQAGRAYVCQWIDDGKLEFGT